MEATRTISEILCKLPLTRLWALLLLALISATCVTDYFAPLEDLMQIRGFRYQVAGYFMMLAMLAPSIWCFQLIPKRPSVSLLLPLIYWGWYYATMFTTGSEPIHSAPNMLATLGASLLGYFVLGFFFSPAIIVLELASIGGFVIMSRMVNDSRRVVAAVFMVALQVAIMVAVIQTDSLVLRPG
ncbi:MAG: hypothetical protein AAB412_02965 [Elusimicrobiota bacterium]